MGCFSWIDCYPDPVNTTDSRRKGNFKHTNIMMDDSICILLPEILTEKIFEEFPDAKHFYDEKQCALRGYYTGYGEIEKTVTDENGKSEEINIDVYDLVAFMNLRCIEAEKAHNLIEQVVEKPQRVNHHNYEAALKNYEEEKSTLHDYVDFGEIFVPKDSSNMMYELRHLGIDIACYDNQSVQLPYPIKMTYNKNVRYEDVFFSMRDPNQGVCKLNQNSYKELIYKLDTLLEQRNHEDKEQEDDLER